MWRLPTVQLAELVEVLENCAVSSWRLLHLEFVGYGIARQRFDSIEFCVGMESRNSSSNLNS